MTEFLLMTEFLQDPIRWSVAFLMLTFIATFLVTATAGCAALTVHIIKNFPRLGNKND